jgi:hypothetical protein
MIFKEAFPSIVDKKFTHYDIHSDDIGTYMHSPSICFHKKDVIKHCVDKERLNIAIMKAENDCIKNGLGFAIEIYRKRMKDIGI